MSTPLSSDQQTILSSHMEGVQDLAVDWIHDIIYWTDAILVSISASNLGKQTFINTIYVIIE